MKFTHKELVEIAYKWLVKNGRVGVVIKELMSTSGEIPDVIGFCSWESVLIECKTSRTDFFRDKKKIHRQVGGMGKWRFICCPQNMIEVSELPEKWGLIYVNEKGKARIEYDCRIKKIKQNCKDKYDWERHPEGFYYSVRTAEENEFVVDVFSERKIMYSALRRMFIKGHLNAIYDKQYNRLSNSQILTNHEQADTV